MNAKAIQQEALSRAVSGLTMANYPAIFQGFMERGIPEEAIKPRENVFTFQAWKALGRYVRKGEHGVRVVTYIDYTRKQRDEQTGEEQEVRLSRPWTTTVFHVSQTEAVEVRS